MEILAGSMEKGKWVNKGNLEIKQIGHFIFICNETTL
jgi:hypothetical protein